MKKAKKILAAAIAAALIANIWLMSPIFMYADDMQASDGLFGAVDIVNDIEIAGQDGVFEPADSTESDGTIDMANSLDIESLGTELIELIELIELTELIEQTEIVDILGERIDPTGIFEMIDQENVAELINLENTAELINQEDAADLINPIVSSDPFISERLGELTDQEELGDYEGLALADALFLCDAFETLSVDEADDSDVVFSESELADWINRHSDTGGTVRLGCDVTIEWGVQNYSYADFTIDTGKYGLTYDGGYISLAYPVAITGEGVEAPVLTVIETNAFRMSWIHAIQELSVTATGREIDDVLLGGTAVYIAQGNGWPTYMDYFLGEGLIRSYGQGAIGVKLAACLDLYCLNIQADGEGSVAIWAPLGANLYYCKLSASGAGAVAAAGQNILLDACSVSPACDGNGVTAITRSIIDISGSRLYLPIPQCESFPEYYLWPYFNIQFLLQGGGEIKEELFNVYWDYHAFNDIDFSSTGKSVVGGALPPPFEGLGLTDGFPLELIIDVRDPGVPCISGMGIYGGAGAGGAGPGGGYAVFEYWLSGAWDQSDLILWRSDDGGGTWYDATGDDDIEWLQPYEWEPTGSIYYSFGAIASPVMFQLEAPGFGESNIAAIYDKDGLTFGDTGGDRTGADRIIGKKLPTGEPSGDESSTGEGDPMGDPPSDGGDSGGDQPTDETPAGELPAGDGSGDGPGLPPAGNGRTGDGSPGEFGDGGPGGIGDGVQDEIGDTMPDEIDDPFIDADASANSDAGANGQLDSHARLPGRGSFSSAAGGNAFLPLSEGGAAILLTSEGNELPLAAGQGGAIAQASGNRRNDKNYAASDSEYNPDAINAIGAPYYMYGSESGSSATDHSAEASQDLSLIRSGDAISVMAFGAKPDNAQGVAEKANIPLHGAALSGSGMANDGHAAPVGAPPMRNAAAAAGGSPANSENGGTTGINGVSILSNDTEAGGFGRAAQAGAGAGAGAWAEAGAGAQPGAQTSVQLPGDEADNPAAPRQATNSQMQLILSGCAAILLFGLAGWIRLNKLRLR